ncbi:MAG: helix-turn-helix transcriptional regulator [Paracoccaceae bacterium]
MKKPKLHNKLKLLRGETGAITQQQLGDAVNVSRQTIIALESGRYFPSLALALKIARVFDCTVETIFWLPSEDK